MQASDFGAAAIRLAYKVSVGGEVSVSSNAVELHSLETVSVSSARRLLRNAVLQVRLRQSPRRRSPHFSSPDNHSQGCYIRIMVQACHVLGLFSLVRCVWMGTLQHELQIKMMHHQDPQTLHETVAWPRPTWADATTPPVYVLYLS